MKRNLEALVLAHLHAYDMLAVSNIDEMEDDSKFSLLWCYACLLSKIDLS